MSMRSPELLCTTEVQINSDVRLQSDALVTAHAATRVTLPLRRASGEMISHSGGCRTTQTSQALAAGASRCAKSTRLVTSITCSKCDLVTRDWSTSLRQGDVIYKL